MEVILAQLGINSNLYLQNKLDLSSLFFNVGLDNLVDLLNNEHYKDKNVVIFNLNCYLNNIPAFNINDKEIGFYKVTYEQHNFLVGNIKKQMIKYILHKLIILD